MNCGGFWYGKKEEKKGGNMRIEKRIAIIKMRDDKITVIEEIDTSQFFKMFKDAADVRIDYHKVNIPFWAFIFNRRKVYDDLVKSILELMKRQTEETIDWMEFRTNDFLDILEENNEVQKMACKPKMKPKAKPKKKK